MYDFYFKLCNKTYKKSYIIDEKYINNIKIIKDLDYYYFLLVKIASKKYEKRIISKTIH